MNNFRATRMSVYGSCCEEQEAKEAEVRSELRAGTAFNEARLLRSPHDVANLATLFGCHPTAAAQAVAANAQVVLRRAGRLRAHDPLAPPPASGLFDLEPDSASSSFGTFAALEAPGAAVGLAGAAAEAAGAGGDATEPPRQAVGSKKRRKR